MATIIVAESFICVRAIGLSTGRPVAVLAAGGKLLGRVDLHFLGRRVGNRDDLLALGARALLAGKLFADREARPGSLGQTTEIGIRRLVEGATRGAAASLDFSSLATERGPGEASG